MIVVNLLKLIHIFTAIWMITGMVARNITLSRAASSSNLDTVRALMPVVAIFHRRFVIPGSEAVFVAGILTALAEGWPILGFLQGGASNWVLVSLLLYLTTIPLVIFVFVPRGKRFDAAYQDAIAKNTVTPELAAAFHDPAVWGARNYEVAIIAIIVALMVLKPF